MRAVRVCRQRLGRRAQQKGEFPAVAFERDLGHPVRRHQSEGAGDVPWPRDPPVIDREHKITWLDAGLVGKAARLDAGDQGGRPPCALLPVGGNDLPAGLDIVHLPIGLQGIGDAYQERGRNSEIHAGIGVVEPGEDGVQLSHKTAFHIDQRTAGAAGVDRGVGLHEVLHRVEAGIVDAQRGDDAAGDGEAEPVLIADAADRLRQLGLRRDGEGRQTLIDTQQGDIARHVVADQPCRDDAAVPEPDVDTKGGLDHVPGGRDQIARADGDAGSLRRDTGRRTLAALGLARPDRQDRDDRAEGLRRDGADRMREAGERRQDHAQDDCPHQVSPRFLPMPADRPRRFCCGARIAAPGVAVHSLVELPSPVGTVNLPGG